MWATYFACILAGALFLGMVLLLEVGRRAGLRRATEDAAGARAGLGTIDAAVFSLLGLLVAFTFSGAAQRYDARRQLAIQEGNSIGTAWLRLDNLPETDRAELRQNFRQYLDARLRVAQKMPDVQAALDELRNCSKLQDTIWTKSISACKGSAAPQVAMLLLPALNQMFDIAASRTAMARFHPPAIIQVMLFALSLASAVLAGYGMSGAKRRSYIHFVGLAAAIAAAVFVIIDLEYPRAGLIHLSATDQILIELRQDMDSTK